MTRTQIIDLLRTGRPLNAKLVKEIVAELEKAQRLEEAARPVCEWDYWAIVKDEFGNIDHDGRLFCTAVNALCREVGE